MSTPSAWAAVAAIYTAFSCLGPRSRLARRELNRALSTIAPTPLAAATALLMLAAITTTTATLILFGTAPLWPVPSLSAIQIHISGLIPASFHG